MGGTNFVETAPGVFKASRQSTCGFSWPELYLMGLAAPEEVPPWFYLRNPDRDIPASLPTPIEVRAMKEVVTIDDLIRGMGPRNPSSATSRKTFRVLFAVVDTPREPATDDRIDMVDSIRAPFEREFVRVTGGRGAMDTSIKPRSRRRAVQH
jgi:hypothetical protein